MSKKKSRRDFIVIASYSMGAVGAGAAIWPIINQMNPAADTLAMASTEVNIGALEIGQALTCLLYTSPSPRDQRGSRMHSCA